MAKREQNNTQVTEVRYIKCQIMKSDVDTTSGIVTLQLMDVGFQSDVTMWFQEDLKPTWYKIELDASSEADRALLFDNLIKFTRTVNKYDKIIDKIEKGLIGKVWSFSEKKLQPIK